MPNFIIWWAVLVHMVWGIALIVDPAVGPVAVLVGLHWLIAFGIHAQILGALLFASAVVAGGSLAFGHRLSNRVSLLLLLPQYGLVVAAIVSDAVSIWLSTVNGQPVVDRLLLFTALWPVMVAGALHSVAIAQRHWLWTE